MVFLERLRATQPGTPIAIVRVLLGVLFLMTGLMKLFVPELRAAFSGQLTAAAIPAHSLNMWLVPLAEVLMGSALIAGFLSRLPSLDGDFTELSTFAEIAAMDRLGRVASPCRGATRAA